MSGLRDEGRPELPCGDAGTPAPRAATRACDLCGLEHPEHSYSEAAWDASGLDICSVCIEDMLDANTHDARTEVGLVGARH